MTTTARGAVIVAALLAVSGCASPSQANTSVSSRPAPTSGSTVSGVTPISGGVEALRTEYTNLSAMTTHSDAVVIARARSSRVRTVTGAQNGSAGAPPTLEETYTTVAVERVARGTIPATVEVSQLGSRSGGRIEDGAPLLEAGRTYLLFFKKGPFGNYGITGGRVVYEEVGSQFRRTGPSTPDDSPRTASTTHGTGSAAPIPDTIEVDKVDEVVAEAAGG